MHERKKTFVNLAVLLELNPTLWKWLPKLDREAMHYNVYAVTFLMITLCFRYGIQYPDPKPILGTVAELPADAPMCPCCDRPSFVTSTRGLCLYCSDIESTMLKERHDPIPIEQLKEGYEKEKTVMHGL